VFVFSENVSLLYMIAVVVAI